MFSFFNPVLNVQHHLCERIHNKWDIFFHVACQNRSTISRKKQKTQREIKLYSIVDVHIRAILLQEATGGDGRLKILHTHPPTNACMSTHIHTENNLVILLAVKHSCATNVTHHKHTAFLKLGSKMSS